MIIRPVRAGEEAAWLEMRVRLWPDSTREQLAREQSDLLAGAATNAVLVAVDEAGRLAGLAEVSLREWAEGCESHPVGYLEGWWVEADQRRKGLGARLVRAAEDWARSQGCTEMASDAALGNSVSHAAHAALGYAEVGRAVLFRRDLEG